MSSLSARVRAMATDLNVRLSAGDREMLYDLADQSDAQRKALEEIGKGLHLIESRPIALRALGQSAGLRGNE